MADVSNTLRRINSQNGWLLRIYVGYYLLNIGYKVGDTLFTGRQKSYVTWGFPFHDIWRGLITQILAVFFI